MSTVNLMNQYIVYKNQQLGKGSTGKVYGGRCLRHNKNVAIKIIDLTTIDNQVSEYLLLMEKTALMSVCNPYILKGIKTIQNNKNCYLITELCNGGTLKDYIKGNSHLGQQKSIQIFNEIIKGQLSLIQKGILHRDLKPANILLHNGQVKIIDFGYCQIKGFSKPSLQYNVGSPSYMSPEAFKKNEYSQKSQVWAAGVTLYECLNGNTFDLGRNMKQVYEDLDRYGLQFKVAISKKLQSIIRWCLQKDPSNRPTFNQIYSFLNQKNNQQLIFLNSVQSTRDSFASIEQITRKSTQRIDHKNCQKKNYVQKYNDQMLAKKDVLKKPFIQDKFRSTSSYAQAKAILDKKLSQKATILSTKFNKYERNVFKPLENISVGFSNQFYGDQLVSKQPYHPSKLNCNYSKQINTDRPKVIYRPSNTIHFSNEYYLNTVYHR